MSAPAPRVLVALLLGLCACSTGPSTDDVLAKAAELFDAGEFARAETEYRAVLERDARNGDALVALGSLALYAHRFAEAEELLTRAVDAAADPAAPQRILAECYYRQDDFEGAARLAREAGEELRAAQLETFAGQEPNRIVGDAQVTTLPFVRTDPLPIVALSVNGRPPGIFLIDTGGGELILSAEYAQQVGALTVGSFEGLYAGGQRRETHTGRVDSVVLGDLELRDVPVQINPGVQGVAGILGTIPLYHFIPTLDYVRGALVLRRKTDANRAAVDALAREPGSIQVPFRMAGDHMIVARGSVNGGPESTFFVDTGLAGHAFTAPESTIWESQVELRQDKAQIGQGPGGEVRIVPFEIEELTLGDARVRGLEGLYGPFPPQLERLLGFRVAGIVSHMFFRRFAVTFDFEQMRIVLQPEEGRT